MKEAHLQTPQKQQHLIANRTKKNQKITKKCLNSAFNSASEDVVFESPKDSFESSSVSEDNQLCESPPQSLTAPLNPVLSPLSENIALSDLTPLSSIITTDMSDKDEGSHASVSASQKGSGETSGVNIRSMEVEMVVKFLTEAWTQVLKSDGVDCQSKKLFDGLIKFIIDELYGLPEERYWFTELALKKAHVMLLSFVVWIFAVWMALSFGSGCQSSSYKPPPT